ncbi:MAG: response regulator transcription factor [Myxococcota bacterium]|nr:response regulator transcription factor [Myxococcota bacterium]
MRVLLIDDHAIVRRGTRELLVEELPDAEFEEAGTGEDALSLVGHARFDLAILDISMPRRGGIDTLKELQVRAPSLPVLVLSQHAEEQYAIRALRSGARGYLTKNSAPEELARAARTILGGGKYVSEQLAQQLAGSLTIDPSKPPHESLSDRELEVLRMIGAGKSVKDIAAELSLSAKTVSTYRTRILEKMRMGSSAELMRYVLRTGLTE